ncbi:MAG: serine hydrolase domain-containing protein [Reyranellales bacterium]
MPVEIVQSSAKLPTAAIMRPLALIFLAACFAPATLPARAQTVADIEQAWRGWMIGHGRTAGGLVVLRQDRVVHEVALGREGVGASVPIASLSKAVTAVCIAGLIDQGRLSFDTPLAQALAGTFARLGGPADPRLAQATVGQLLAHRAGFDRDKGGDAASAPLKSYLRTNTATRTAYDDTVRMVLRQKLPLPPGERYSYSNAPYLLLGAVVEEASRQNYETYCGKAVLAPLGARGAALDPAWRILSSYGGWRMPLADYGRFYQAFATGNPAIGPVARRWMMSPDGKAIGGGAHYGLGTDVRPLPSGAANFWHWGRWSYSLDGAYDGPLRISYATYAVRYGAMDVNLVAYMEPTLGGTDLANFDRTLGTAAGAVKRWP